MPTLLRMPEVAANATQAVLRAWITPQGTQLTSGQCVAEIETDKAMVEVLAERPGRLVRHLVGEGEQVDVGRPIGVISHDDDSPDGIEAFLAACTGATPGAGERNTSAPPEEHSGSDMPAQPAAAEARIFASPLARRIARACQIDLADVRGSGPNGRILKRDVEAARGQALPAVRTVGQDKTGPKAQQPTAQPSRAGSRPHSTMRKVIARRLAGSKATIPHFYLSATCRVDRLIALRTELNATTPMHISVNDLLVRAAALALKEIPEVNVSWTEDAMNTFENADVCFAVATEAGLMTPVVRCAETKSLSVLSREMADLAARARSGRLSASEIDGGSFTVSNLGMHGVTEFSAIINPPQAAILAVGAIHAVPAVADGAIAIQNVICCTLSVDHRAIDGAVAARWLSCFRRLVETPLFLLV